jgi:regulator of sirC expression with transglutaminase-like and TPR domain
VDSIAQRFSDLVAPGSGRIDGELDEGALLIAAALQPPVDIAEQIGRLDRLAEESGAESLEDLLAFLFGARGFSGDRDQYYDARNSYLNLVLDRRLGIPITLSVLTIEIGRRVGLAIDGIGMPGHFLVHSEGVFVDVFGGGVLLDRRGCAELLATIAGGPIELAADGLDVTPPGAILRRMLLNLRMIGQRNQDWVLLRGALTLLTSFPEPDVADLLLLARSHAAGGGFDRAALVAERAVDLMPEAGREGLLGQIQAWRARLN